ncbi:MAG: hypothetical protein V9G19_05715 [Tetrasphaera sp.]
MRRGASAVLTLATAGALTGCGNWITTDIVGAIAMTADAQGNPVVIVARCGAPIDMVEVSQHPDVASATGGPDADPIVLRLTAPEPPNDVFTVSLTDPGPPWQAEGRFDPAAQEMFWVSGAVSDKDMATTVTQVTRAAYEGLDAEHVVIREGEVWTRAEFDARACNRESWPVVTES